MDRDDKTLRHFGARSQQPKVLAGAQTAAKLQNHAPPTINVYIHDRGVDQCNFSDEIEANRFKYMGTSPSISPYVDVSRRHTAHNFMKSSFYS